MSNLVCTGAALQCSMGTTPATFSASGQAVGAPTGAGVISDIGPQSVPGFGLCTSMANPQVAAASTAGLVPQPCIPVIAAPWTPGSTSVTLDGQPALDDASQCLCTWAGTITVSSAGQTDTTLA
jgi:Domain of unknown function (DUF4280)